MWKTAGQPSVVALGSNLGDRLGNLTFAVRGLAGAGVCVKTVSSVFETAPMGFLDQPTFYNMVCSFLTDLPPRRVLAIFQSLEEEAGRIRGFRNSPRTLDLDLLFYGGRIVREEGLLVPHPRWKGRSFVVQPLMEVAPGLRDPETGWTVQEVARSWPREPQETRVVMSPEEFERVLSSTGQRNE